METIFLERVAPPGVNWYKIGVVFTICGCFIAGTTVGAISLLKMSESVVKAADAYNSKTEASIAVDTANIAAMKAATDALVIASDTIKNTPISITNRVVVTNPVEDKRDSENGGTEVTNTSYPVGSPTATRLALDNNANGRFFANKANNKRKRQ